MLFCRANANNSTRQGWVRASGLTPPYADLWRKPEGLGGKGSNYKPSFPLIPPNTYISLTLQHL
jgi:hypothetical protein